MVSVHCKECGMEYDVLIHEIPIGCLVCMGELIPDDEAAFELEEEECCPVGTLIGSHYYARCAFCGKLINRRTEFRDDRSEKEYQISFMCQACQDKVFGK